jgi:hypothetical protein
VTAYSLSLIGGGVWLASDILGELGGAGHLVTAWGFDSPVFFRYRKLTGPTPPTPGGVSVLPNWGWWLIAGGLYG